MKEYKIVENTPSIPATEQMLSELSNDRWEVSSFGQFQILLEREKEDEVKTVEQICG
jgi:hypothetical protein